MESSARTEGRCLLWERWRQIHLIVMTLLLFTGIMIKDGWEIMMQSFRGGTWMAVSCNIFHWRPTHHRPSVLPPTWTTHTSSGPEPGLSSCYHVGRNSQMLYLRDHQVFEEELSCGSLKRKRISSPICPRYRGKVYTAARLGRIVIFGVTIAGNNICFLYM